MRSTINAELGSVAEAVSGYRRRVAGLVDGLSSGTDDDLISALWEAERCLGIAETAVRRARRTAG